MRKMNRRRPKIWRTTERMPPQTRSWGLRKRARTTAKDTQKHLIQNIAKVVPYSTLIISGIYGAVNSPKLVTIPDAKRDSPSLPHKMLAMCYVSADPGGCRYFVTKCSTIEMPLCVYDANQNKDTNSFKGPRVVVCSIDNMPTQLPREGMDLFGSLVVPHMYDMLKSDTSKPFEEQSFTHEVHGVLYTCSQEQEWSLWWPYKSNNSVCCHHHEIVRSSTYYEAVEK
nr:alpha-aminoadipic semialdehyde synthase, mitochondrial-like isoform X2 [Cherax quadricarinatus]